MLIPTILSFPFSFLGFLPDNLRGLEETFDNRVSSDTISELEKVVNISSLTGNPVSRNDFKHNNMVPFFGGRIRGAGANYDQAELNEDNQDDYEKVLDYFFKSTMNYRVLY